MSLGFAALDTEIWRKKKFTPVSFLLDSFECLAVELAQITKSRTSVCFFLFYRSVIFFSRDRPARLTVEKRYALLFFGVFFGFSSKRDYLVVEKKMEQQL